MPPFAFKLLLGVAVPLLSFAFGRDEKFIYLISLGISIALQGASTQVTRHQTLGRKVADVLVLAAGIWFVFGVLCYGAMGVARAFWASV